MDCGGGSKAGSNGCAVRFHATLLARRHRPKSRQIVQYEVTAKSARTEGAEAFYRARVIPKYRQYYCSFS